MNMRVIYESLMEKSVVIFIKSVASLTLIHVVVPLLFPKHHTLTIVTPVAPVVHT